MAKFRISRARQWRRVLVRMFGRRPVVRPRRPRPAPAYRKVTAYEVCQFLDWRRRGWSARKIAHRAERDHHTVLRWLRPSKAVARLLRAPTVAHLRLAATVARRVSEVALRRALLAQITAARLARIERERAQWARRVSVLRDGPPSALRARRDSADGEDER